MFSAHGDGGHTLEQHVLATKLQAPTEAIEGYAELWRSIKKVILNIENMQTLQLTSTESTGDTETIVTHLREYKEVIKTRQDGHSAARDKLLQELEAACETVEGTSESKPMLENKTESYIQANRNGQMLEDRRNLIYAFRCVILLLLYIFGFGLVFTYLEQSNPNGAWTLIDGWYFSVLTLGTVGYGVLVPSNDYTRIAVILTLSLGLAFSLFTMGIVTEIFLKRFESALEATGLQEKKWVFFDVRALGISLVLFFMMAVGVLYGMAWEGWSFIISLYWVYATMTTVGYGDFAPSTQTSRAVISFYILACGGLFAAILTLVIASYLATQKRAMTVRFLLGNLSLENLIQAAKERDPNCDHITRQDFHQFMLVQMGYVDNGVLTLVDDAFNRMDVDGDGTLTVHDIGSATTMSRAQMLAELRAVHGVAVEDEMDTPYGFLGIKFKFKQ